VPLWDRRTGDGPVVFGACGVMSARKDPFKLLEAWRDFRVAHPEIAARLEIKTMPPTLHPKIVEAYPDVVIHEEMWTRGRLMDWYGTLDCMVSTSRGEGMNKPAVEFMASGGPVLASAWGGHENWMRADCGYPVKYELSPCPFEPGTVDAPVDRQDLAAMFHAVALDRPGRLARGATAANYARSALTWERSVEKLRRLVAEKS
jgi:glycosyltransferase involved in cell wall biosynthesis